MKKILLIILIINFIFSYSIVKAQVQTPVDGVTISSDPEKPAPEENVKVTLESYSVDLSSASIIWNQDGKNIGHGVGLKEITIKSPIIGKKTIVTAIISSNDNREIRKGIVIQSGAVDIIWETKSYTIPFFKGKNPLVYQNKVKITAIPHLSSDGKKEVNPKNLVYKWKRDGKYIDGASGYGNQSVTIDSGDIPKPLDISVDVYTRDQNQNTINSIKINPTDPSISFYEIDPLYGILFNRALNNRFSLNNSEITLLAAPYGFNNENNSKNLSYVWSINGLEQSDLTKNQSITLRSKPNTEGSSEIGLDMRDITAIMQAARSTIEINFKKRAENNEDTTF